MQSNKENAIILADMKSNKKSYYYLIVFKRQKA